MAARHLDEPTTEIAENAKDLTTESAENTENPAL